MWRFRPKSSVQIHNSSTTFSCSSFKDIQHLCSAADPQHPQSKTSTVFHRVCLANSVLRALSSQPTKTQPEPEPEPDASPSSSPLRNAAVDKSKPSIFLPGTEKRVVIYFTSLRVVRSTFENCKTVLSILRGFRISVDARDLSMDSAFLEELRRILDQNEISTSTLPRVFIGGRYIGGAEEIRLLHETGELKKFVERLPAAGSGTCEVCGGYRFILCDECSGSHKCYSEKGGFRSCTTCNENGLIRCPSCYYTPF